MPRGKPKKTCGATTRAGGKCGLAAGAGTDHVGIGRCARHGGNTRNHKIAARKELARQAVATYGLAREIDPATALLEEVHRTAGHVAWLGQVVAALDKDELVWGLAEETDRPPSESSPAGGIETKRKAAPSVWVELYQAERAHLAKVAKAAIDAGVNERVVGVFERVGATYVALLNRVFDRLELSEQQRALVPEVVTAELRAIAGGG